MNKLNDLIIASSMCRRMGKTTAICKAAKEIGATVICANQTQANMIKEYYGIKTITLSNNIRGTKGPYLYDHFAMEQLFFELEDDYKKENESLMLRIIKTEIDNSYLKEEILMKSTLIKGLDLEIEKLKKRKKRKNVKRTK